MTREEALQILDTIPTIGEQVDALEMAIQALEQQPCDDAISRQAVLNTLDNMDKTLDEDRTVENYKELLEECYEVLHSVTPQQKYGKWIDYREDGFVECPFCDHATNCEDDIDELHYCFYCGARMIKPQESEEV